MARNDPVEVCGDLVNETPKAWIFAVDGDEDNVVPVPKSISKWEPDEEDGVTGTMTVPEWFAEKEGMI